MEAFGGQREVASEAAAQEWNKNGYILWERTHTLPAVMCFLQRLWPTLSCSNPPQFGMHSFNPFLDNTLIRVL